MNSRKYDSSLLYITTTILLATLSYCIYKYMCIYNMFKQNSYPVYIKKTIHVKSSHFTTIKRNREKLREKSLLILKKRYQKVDIHSLYEQNYTSLDSSQKIEHKHPKQAKKINKKSSHITYSKVLSIELIWPICKNLFWISSCYGNRFNQFKKKIEFHRGIDMAATLGTPVKAASSGKVIEANCLPGFGNCIVIEHPNNIKTRYAHLDSILISKGSYVKTESIIGTVGNTGNTRGKKNSSHLHFELLINNSHSDPLPYLNMIK